MMTKSKILGVVVLSTLMCAGVAKAICPAPPIQDLKPVVPTTTDPIRNATGAVLSLLSLGEEPVQIAEVNVKQQEVGALAEGDTSYQVNEGTGDPASGLDITAYDHLIEKDQILSGKYTPYAPLNNKIDGGKGDTKQAILDLFFLPNKSTLTQDEVDKVKKNREDYLKTISDAYVRLAYETQMNLATDMDAVTADINANGTIGVISGIDQTWKAVNKALIVDIALQIELMELDAAKFLTYQPVILMDETPPSDLQHESKPDATSWTGGSSNYAAANNNEKK